VLDQLSKMGLKGGIGRDWKRDELKIKVEEVRSNEEDAELI
jgi:hypothetical protein